MQILTKADLTPAARRTVGNDTSEYGHDGQTKTGLLPADGYGGLKVLARLRQGSQRPCCLAVQVLKR